MLNCSEEIERLKKLGRKEIIKLAVNKIKEDYLSFNVENFEHIIVRARSENMDITFNTSIVFVPMNSTFSYSVFVRMGKDEMFSVSHESNPHDFENDGNIKFFNSTEKSKNTLKFIFGSINKSSEVGSIDTPFSKDEKMLIYEENDGYRIEVDSPEIYSSYKIMKDSGKTVDAMHKHTMDACEKENKEFEGILE